MPGDVMALQALHPSTSESLAESLAHLDATGWSATVVGYGVMGRQYVAALRALGVRSVRVCARSASTLQELRGAADVEALSGGVESLNSRPRPSELGIVATPIPSLIPAAKRLAWLGFRRLLIEKPVALRSGDIERLTHELAQEGVEAWCAYNRAAYPSLQELRAWAEREGGITSCTYDFTERIKPEWPQRFPLDVLARWGIANSMHVISMAHALIGAPRTWQVHRTGQLSWHPSGSVFVGSGISERGMAFAYHADWGSAGRWAVEAHTAAASYRLCPLEQLVRRDRAAADWTEVPVRVWEPTVKAGLTEQVAAAMSPEIRHSLPLVSLEQAAALTRYAEDIFGYAR